MKKLAFIGVGNMASAIINGILSSGAKVASANDLVLFDRFETQCASFLARGVEVAKSAPDAVKSAEYVLIAVKPQNLGELLDELSSLDLDNKTFISICAESRPKPSRDGSARLFRSSAVCRTPRSRSGWA